MRRGRPLERILFQAAEVAATAAAVCLITLACNHVRHRDNKGKPKGEKRGNQADAGAYELADHEITSQPLER